MKKQKYFKCPKCGEPTVQDPLGYSPSVPYCTKCNHICDWECPEAERLGLGSEEEYKIYLKGKKESDAIIGFNSPFSPQEQVAIVRFSLKFRALAELEKAIVCGLDDSDYVKMNLPWIGDDIYSVDDAEATDASGKKYGIPEGSCVANG